MGSSVMQSDDAPTIPPHPQNYIPGTKSKLVPIKADGNASGALWRDHHGPSQPGGQGNGGWAGVSGRDGLNSDDTPQGYKLFIPPDTDTRLTLGVEKSARLGCGQP
jgi:hypothetical protein